MNAALRVVLTRLRLAAGQAQVRIVCGRPFDAAEVEDLELDLGVAPAGRPWTEVNALDCPDCGAAGLSWRAAAYVPNMRVCMSCGSMFAVEARVEREAAGLRRLQAKSGAEAVYRVPLQSHWSTMRTAAEIEQHGELVARRVSGGPWLFPDGWEVAARQAAIFGLLPVVAPAEGDDA